MARSDLGYGSWREYQIAVAEMFRELGCDADEEATVRGARATHKVDVRFKRHGVDCRWIVECKLWQRPVEKSHVEALKSIVDDIGADRGILFSEHGYQSGAHDAASRTNILLQTSLEEFKRTAQLDETRVALVREEPDESGGPPVYAFPGGERPQHILLHERQLFVGNWGTGSIAIVEPATRTVASVIGLDKYEKHRWREGRVIEPYPPGSMAVADGKLFVGQVFSEFVLVIDIETQTVVKRITVPGGGEGAICASANGEHVFFASNKVSSFFIVDSATYEFRQVNYPEGGRGCLCVLAHPSRPLLYLGIQRGGLDHGRSYPGGNCYLATYDLAEQKYVGTLYLAEVTDGRSDDAVPSCLTLDELNGVLLVGMFQSQRGICRVDETGTVLGEDIRFAPNEHNRHFPWVDPLSQAIFGDELLSVNRNNAELVRIDRRSARFLETVFLGEAPNGPGSVVVVGNEAIVSYPERGGLVFHSLEEVDSSSRAGSDQASVER